MITKLKTLRSYSRYLLSSVTAVAFGVMGQ